MRRSLTTADGGQFHGRTPIVASRVGDAKRSWAGDVALALLVATLGLAPRVAHAQDGAVDASRGAVVNSSDEAPPAYPAPTAETVYESEHPPLPPAVAPAPAPVTLALQGFAVAQKVMPGIALRFGKYWGPRVEASFLWTTEPVAGFGAFLGNQFAFYLEATPLRSPRFELSGGLGADVYYLWGVHSDLAKISLSAEANLSYWFTPSLGALLGFRSYPLHSRGLELGTRRDGSSGSPVLISVGLEWRRL